MKIINIKKGNEKLFKAKLLKTSFERAKGLMFSKKKNLLFEMPYESIHLSSIHMFFVFFPIKVVWLDKKKKVIDIKQAKPFQFHLEPRKKAKYILEIPKSSKKNKKIKIGDRLKF